MKTFGPLFLLFIICGTFSCSVFAQQCTDDSLLTYPSGDFVFVGNGFADPQSLPCVKSGLYSELVIPFNTYNQGARLLTLHDTTTIPVTHIYAVKVENITDLPQGFCWTTRPSSQTISGDQTGVLIIKGTGTLSEGIYPLSVKLSLDTKGDGLFNYTDMDVFNYKALLGQVVIRSMGSGNDCPSVNF